MTNTQNIDQAVAYFVDTIERRLAAGVVDAGRYLQEWADRLTADENEIADLVAAGTLQDDQAAEKLERVASKRRELERIARGVGVFLFEADVAAGAEADAQAMTFAIPRGRQVLADALRVLVLDPKIRRGIDPKALDQARDALGLEV